MARWLPRHAAALAVDQRWINEPGRVFVVRGGRSELTTTVLEPGQVQEPVERMLKSSGRRVDLSAPFVDAMLADGSRLHGVIPDITRALVGEHPRVRRARRQSRRRRSRDVDTGIGLASPLAR